MTDVNGVPAYQPEPTGTPAGAPYAPAPIAENPGKTMGIVALILAIFLNIVGAIVGIVALNKSKKAGFKNGPALAAIIVGFVLFVLTIIIIVVSVMAGVAAYQQIVDACGGLGGQQVVISGTTVTCPAGL